MRMLKALRALMIALAWMPALAVSAVAAPPRQVSLEVIVAAPPSVVWAHWTTVEGLQTLFVPPEPPLQANIELRADGPYEMLFVMDAPEGMRGGEGSRILAFEQERMLSFTWRNTPQWPSIRPYYTHVIVTFEPLDANRTRVTLTQTGFGAGEDWDLTYDYFQSAWRRVLSRLVERYDTPFNVR